MKNLHIISTDKPSRLFKDDFGKLIYSINIDQEQNHFEPQHLFITNNEEIKEGNWNLPPSNIPVKHQGPKFKGDEPLKCWKKIILTTDGDLIKDGVQVIDDTFLEWFVKNPSCEVVEVKPLLSNNGRALFGYKIIIPKEEPNPFELPKALPDDVFYESLEPKQETLEEVAERIYPNAGYDDEMWCDSGELCREKFIEGAKWQAERMYSEEEVMNILINSLHSVELKDNKNYSKIYNGMKDWFEQFKKK